MVLLPMIPWGGFIGISGALILVSFAMKGALKKGLFWTGIAGGTYHAIAGINNVFVDRSNSPVAGPLQDILADITPQQYVDEIAKAITTKQKAEANYSNVIDYPYRDYANFQYHG